MAALGAAGARGWRAAFGSVSVPRAGGEGPAGQRDAAALAAGEGQVLAQGAAVGHHGALLVAILLLRGSSWVFPLPQPQKGRSSIPYSDTTMFYQLAFAECL